MIRVHPAHLQAQAQEKIHFKAFSSPQDRFSYKIKSYTERATQFRQRAKNQACDLSAKKRPGMQPASKRL
jgi:hypothetical protein